MVAVILEYGVTEVGMESTSIYWTPVWRVIDQYVEQKLVNPDFIRQLSGQEERCEGCGVDSDMHPEGSGPRELCPGGAHPAAAAVRQAHLRPERRHRNESAGRIKARGITHGNKYLRQTIIECAWGASRTRDCFYAKFFYHQTVVRRKSRMKVLVAISRKMLTAAVSAYTAHCKVNIFVVARPRFTNWLMLCVA